MDVPPIAAPIQPVRISDVSRSLPLDAFPNNGSCITAINSDYARSLGLVPGPLDGLSPTVGSAFGDAQMQVLGGVSMELDVPGIPVVMRVCVAVVTNLWKPFVLGRNVIHFANSVSPQSPLADTLHSSIDPSILGDTATVLSNGVAVTTLDPLRFRASHRKGQFRVESVVRASFMVPSAALGTGPTRVHSIMGF